VIQRWGKLLMPSFFNLVKGMDVRGVRRGVLLGFGRIGKI
jgi:hypothetical protein